MIVTVTVTVTVTLGCSLPTPWTLVPLGRAQYERCGMSLYALPPVTLCRHSLTRSVSFFTLSSVSLCQSSFVT